MLTIAASLAACAALGVLLAQPWLPVRAGFIGAACIILAAYRLRTYWQRDLSAPETAERSVVLSIAGTLLCLGYFLARLYQIGPEFDIHSRAARLMATELWTLIIASAAAQWIARAPEVRRDERDGEIAAKALASSCYVLLAMQAALVIWFSLVADAGNPWASAEILVHLFIGSWMLTHVFHGLSCLVAYADMRAIARNST